MTDKKKNTVSITRQDFMDIAGVMFVALDSSGRVILINKKGCEILGYSEGEIIGKDWFSHFLPKKSREEVRSVFNKLINGKYKPPEFYTNSVVTKNGEQRYLSFHNSILRDKEGCIIGTLSSGEDITEQMETDAALQESEERYRAFFDHSLNFVYIYDFKGNLIDANKAALDLFGYSKKELKGMNIYSFLADSKQIPNVERIIIELAETGQHKETSEFKLKKKDGSTIWVETKSSVIYKDGKPAAIQGIGWDVTRRKHDEQQIKKSLHEKEVLLQEIHHRVKNNMQIIISLLRLQSFDVQDRRDLELFKMSQERIYSMALIHEKLYKSKDFTRVNFAHYLESFIIHVLHTYNVDSEKIKYDLDIMEIKADINTAIPLGLVFNELISNAFKHAFPEGRRGKVLIKLGRDKKKKKSILMIKDNGVGIPDELDIKNPKSLGLQLVKDLVKQINGDIRIKKRPGTEIEIIF